MGERGFGSLGFCSFFLGGCRCRRGGPQCTMRGAGPPPGDGMGSDVVLRGGCLERLGLGAGTMLSLAKGPGSCWMPAKGPEGRITWCGVLERVRTTCLRHGSAGMVTWGSAELYPFIFPPKPIPVLGVLLLHPPCGEPRPEG